MADTISGSLITREYKKFRGVDFSRRKDEVYLYRSPDALNVWKNYKGSNGNCIETRPDLELLKKYSDTIFGLFFYTYNGEKHQITHIGDKLYDNDNLIYLVSNTGNMSSMADTFMARHESKYFVHKNKLYIMDGSSYIVYDGTNANYVEGYIPTTTIGKSPAGNGTKYQDVNLLTGIRKNEFIGDGESKAFQLDVESFDSDYTVRAWVNDVETTDFTTDSTKGIITFGTAPPVPNTIGQSNVIIQFKRTVEGYRERIEKCTLVEIFDNRIFFSGNPDFPNILWHSSLDDPSYCSDLDYYEEGSEDAEIKSIVTGNNALWVLKEPSQSNTTVFYHNPALDDSYGKIYPSVHSSISTGCVAKGINFNDVICFFSDRGMEGITGDVTTEQILTHRSSLIDSKLLRETNYKNLILEKWEGYLLVIVDNKIYLADSRVMFNNNDHTEYEWFYWEFANKITGTRVKDGVLYLCCDKEIFTLTKTGEVNAYWTTLDDEFQYPHYQKTTNKKGCVVDMEGEEIVVSVRTDNNGFEKIETYKNTKGYVVPRIKKKKWKSIQLKFSSNKPFYLYSSTLEAYVGSYIKR